MALAIGDKVLYVPHEIHAREHDHTGDFPWVFGWKETPDAEPVEMDHRQMMLKMQQIKKMPSGGLHPKTGKFMAGPKEREASKLALIRPVTLWHGTVKAVGKGKDDKGNEIDTVDIDVCHGSHPVNPKTGDVPVTLHLKNIPVSDVKTPHSCHAAPPSPDHVTVDGVKYQKITNDIPTSTEGP